VHTGPGVSIAWCLLEINYRSSHPKENKPGWRELVNYLIILLPLIELHKMNCYRFIHSCAVCLYWAPLMNQAHLKKKRFYLFIIYLFIYERERVHVHTCANWGRDRGKGRKRISSRLHAQHGAQSQDPETVTWSKIKSRMLNRLSHPGTPKYFTFHSFLTFHRGSYVGSFCYLIFITFYSISDAYRLNAYSQLYFIY